MKKWNDQRYWIVNVRNAVIGLAFVALASFGFTHIDVFESIHSFTRSHEEFQLIEIVFVPISILIGVLIFLLLTIKNSIKRLQNKIRELKATRSKIRPFNDKLEPQVEERRRPLRQASANLNRKTDYVDNIIASMMDSLIVVSPEGTILTVNRTTLDMLGYTEDKITNQPIGIVIEVEEKEKEEVSIFRGAGLDNLVRIGFVANVEKIYLTKDGSRIPVLFSGSVMRDADNNILGIVCMAMDISKQKAVEDKLKESQANFATAQRISHLGSWERNLETGVLNWSAENFRIFGLEQHEFDNSYDSFFKRVHPDDHKEVRHLSAEALSGTPGNTEFRVIRPDGTERTVHAQAELIRDTDGRPVSLAGTNHDITEKKKIEVALIESEQQQHNVLNNATSVIYIKDENGRYMFVNKTFEELFNISNEEIKEMTDHNIFPREIADSFRANDLHVFKINAPVEFEEIAPQKDGPHTYISVKFPLKRTSGEVYGICGISTDITERKQAEEALIAAKQEAEAASRAKTSFLASASHDLRQPLQCLSMLLTVLKNRDHDETSRELIRRIGSSQESLEALLSSLLDVSRLDAGMVEPSRSNFLVGSLTAALVEEFTPLVAVEEVDLRHVFCSALVHSDPVLVSDILRNLLSNAIKFADGGKVLLGCRRQGSNLRFEVRDNGRGIAEDQHEAIFQEFHQVGNLARDRRQGLGLGLAIADRTARLLGGQIDVFSVLGRGSIFTFEFPAGDYEPIRAAVKHQAPAETLEKIFIIIVDDDRDVLDCAGILLESWGHNVLAVPCVEGGDCRRRIKEWRRVPDLIIADYRLQNGINGVDAVKSLRAMFGDGVPAILMTGDTAPDRLSTAVKSGLPLLHKPVRAEDLHSKMLELMAPQISKSPALPL